MPDNTNRIDYQPLFDALRQDSKLQRWVESLPAQVEQGLSLARWGDLPQWQAVLDRLPDLYPSAMDFANGVTIGNRNDCGDTERETLKEILMGLHPWRKGPFELFGLPIDSEWRSDWKWERVAPHLASLEGRLVLDVGCGNGYHCLRIFGAGAKRVIGIDPSPRFVHQFYALRHFTGELPVDVLPLGIEQVPGSLHAFDTVFSMGVLYHRKQPQEHIQELLGCLKPGGQLVLETLVVREPANSILVPEGRYGKMRNVWAIPSPDVVLEWLSASGASNPRLADLNTTTVREQRATEWMRFESLPDFLDPKDDSRTVEGHPAPVRGIFIAEAP